jgi:hypothetical protein
LHATEWAAEEDTIVGEYTVTWDDDNSVTIPIVYGKDVLDWSYDDGSSEPSRAKVHAALTAASLHRDLVCNSVQTHAGCT